VLRITGGILRGKKLFGPKGLEFRPATGQVRQYIFNLYRNELFNTRFLDLFSGTGSFGLEALSRGAGECVFIEKSIPHVRLLKKNVGICGFLEKAIILTDDVFIALTDLGKRFGSFDFIFADPPFKESLRSKIASAVSQNKLLKANGVLIIEHDFRDQDGIQPDLVLERQKRFGHCAISIYSHERIK